MNRILILGASGYIGNAIYKELLPYFNVSGTYFSSKPEFDDNKVLYKLDVEMDNINTILEEVQPNFIISSLRGDFESQFNIHQQVVQYTLEKKKCRILYLSSVNVFDAKYKFPSYENDTVLADSEYGRFKVSIEKLISTLHKSKYAILRLPIVLGVNSPKTYTVKKKLLSIKQISKFILT